jgi:hypothetical protein
MLPGLLFILVILFVDVKSVVTLRETRVNGEAIFSKETLKVTENGFIIATTMIVMLIVDGEFRLG